MVKFGYARGALLRLVESVIMLREQQSQKVDMTIPTAEAIRLMSHSCARGRANFLFPQ